MRQFFPGEASGRAVERSSGPVPESSMCAVAVVRLNVFVHMYICTHVSTALLSPRSFSPEESPVSPPQPLDAPHSDSISSSSSSSSSSPSLELEPEAARS